MRIPRLPDSVKALPSGERVARLQEIVNAELHRQNICPVGEYVAGPRTNRVGVHRRNGAYYAESNFSNYNRQTGESTPETHLEEIALEAIGNAP
jgi:hypothetical protein